MCIIVKQTDDDVDQMKYKVRESDFALQLVLILDLFRGVKEVMEKVQGVQNNVWNTIELVEALLQDLDEKRLALMDVGTVQDLSLLDASHFPLTVKHASDLADNKFKGMDLLEGWLVVPTSKTKVEWVLKDFAENVRDIVDLCSDVGYIKQ